MQSPTEQDILNMKQIQTEQLSAIQDKEQLLVNRSRMLQIAQDRNAYKTKVIYTLIAIIFLIFILILYIYVMYNKNR